MGIRSTLAQLLTAPAAIVFESAVQEVVAETLDARGLIPRRDLDDVAARIDRFREELAARRADLDAMQQSVAAFDPDLDDDLGDALDATDAKRTLDQLGQRRAQLDKQLGRVQGAVTALAEQLGALEERTTTATARARQAHQAATTARATAESAADGATSA